MHDLMQMSDKLRAVGIETGAQNRPGTMTRDVDTNENELRYVVEKKLYACQFHYEGKLRTLIDAAEAAEQQLKDKTFGPALQRVTAQCRSFLKELLERSRASLLELRREEVAHGLALATFKKDHGRRNPPLLPISTRAHFTLLAAIALFEALFNIAFYGEFRGIFTAALIALGASLANVAVSAFLGTLWRFKNSTSGHERRLGWTYFTAWAAYIFYLNKLIASFRASLERVPVDATDAITQASQLGSALTFTYPWGGFIQLDITSWFLFIFGMIIAVAAFLKGYQADDPYPQYGAHVRRHAQARDKYLAAERAMYAAVDAFLRDSELTVMGLVDERRVLLAGFNEKAQGILKVFYDYKIDIDTIASDFAQLTHIYRDANRAARSTPVPPLFEAAPKLELRELRVPYRWQRKSLEKHRSNLHALFRDIQAAGSKARKEVTRLTRIHRRVIRMYLREIENECRRSQEGWAS